MISRSRCDEHAAALVFLAPLDPSTRKGGRMLAVITLEDVLIVLVVVVILILVLRHV